MLCDSNLSIVTEGYEVGITISGAFPFQESENSKISSGVFFFECIFPCGD